VVSIALFALPLLLAAAAALTRSAERRALWVPIGGFAHLALVIVALWTKQTFAFGGWLELDALGRLTLLLVSVLFAICSLYVPAYVAAHANLPNRMFCSALLVFLGMMTLVTESQHLGLMWVALEANTLASAPLLFFDRNPRALEATWKYVLIGAVGIALALLGSFFLAYSGLPDKNTSLLFGDLVAKAPILAKPWLHTAFILLFVGYGTKMGLAPMHSWKPDAYGEAPGVVGALLAGGLTTCAFLALLRFYHIADAGGDGEFARDLMIRIGLVSMAVGGVFMARQRDIKRMLAYSSVEHMGILVLGVGIGGLALYGALLHVVFNALSKGVMFLGAANIQRAYASKSTAFVRGAIRRLPISGGLFLAGFFAVTASPPFAMFLSEFTILRGTMQTGHYGVAALFLILIFVVFVGMGATVLSIVQGKPPADLPDNGVRDTAGTVIPPLILLALVLALGLYIPPALDTLVTDAAQLLGAR
jgi:hydrogenase-4 component F